MERFTDGVEGRVVVRFQCIDGESWGVESVSPMGAGIREAELAPELGQAQEVQ
jgi:hypothetical protein